MDDTTSRLASLVGDRVRQERHARGWTLDELAGETGVSRRTLVHVEQGAVNPSLGTLLRIGDALGVGLPALVEKPRPRPVQVTRHGQGPTLWSSDAGGRAVLVASTRPPDVVELWDWTLGPEDRYAGEAHAVGTTELLQVLQGRVTVEVGEETTELGTGDATAFPGDVAHAYRSAGPGPARFSLAVFEPGVGSGSRTASDGA